MPTLRQAVRQLVRHPRFTFLTVLVTGTSIAATATVFTVVDAVVLEPLPYEAPDRLVALWDVNSEEGLAQEPLSPVNFMDQRELPVFTDAAAWWRPAVNLVDTGLEPTRVSTIETSANLFDVLGVRPQVGAGFPEDGPFFSGELIAVISDRLWRNRYGADPAIVGRPLSFNGTPFTVVGVMPQGFHYPDDVDVWQRLQWDLTQHSRSAHFMEAVGRLAPDETLESARSAVAGLAARLGSEHPESNRGWSTRLVPLLHDQLGYYRPALLVLFGAVGLLLAIGVLNACSLLLTRTLAREREVAVRVSLGASPGQLLRQLLAEALVLTSSGAVVGVAGATVALPLLLRFLPTDIPRLATAGIDLRVLGVVLAVMASVTLIFGLAPARALLRPSIGADLRSGERGSSSASRRAYALLVVGEIAFACALLVASGLLVRTVREMAEVPVGVTADDVTVASIQLSRSEIAPEATRSERWRQIASLHSRILEEVRRQPGVRSAGASNFLPFDEGWRVGFGVEGAPPLANPDDAPQAQFHSWSEGYLQTMGARLVAGRDLLPSDDDAAPGVVLVNETFVRRHLGGGSAVGVRLSVRASGIGPLGTNLKSDPENPGAPVPFEIVGVVADVRNVPLGQAVEPALHFSTRQFAFAEVTVAVDAVDRATAEGALRHALVSVAPGVPLGTPSSWERRLAERSAEARLLTSVLSLFSGLALVLTCAGVYGLLSWSVAMRRRELAIRQALGASPGNVGRTVFGQSTRLVTSGLTLGLAVALIADGALASVLYEVRPGDPLATGGAAAMLFVVATLACLPAILRAMRLDPVDGLRSE